MIVRITFVGIVKDSAGKKKGYRDYIDVHTAAIENAKKMWAEWMKSKWGFFIGHSGVYHPIGNHNNIDYGEMKAESFVERKKED